MTSAPRRPDLAVVDEKYWKGKEVGVGRPAREQVGSEGVK